MRQKHAEPLLPAARRRPAGRRVGRRWLAILISFAFVAAACGDDDDGAAGPTTTAAGDDTTTTTEAEGDDFDPDGVLRIGSTLTFPAGIHLDPTKSAVNTDRPWMELVFGTLLRWSDDGTIEPWMAESYEVVDPQTFQLTIRDGMSFADGAPYDAEAVRDGLLRTLNESNETAVASQSVAFKAIDDVVAEGQTVTITLSEPEVGELAQALADREGVIVSPEQAASNPDEIDSRPIGAGPYVVEEFVADQKVRLVKDPTYWDSDSWRLGAVEWVAVADSAAAVNGLLSGIIDMYTGVDTNDAERLPDEFTVESKPTDRSYMALNLCSEKAPFDDPDVRRALQVGIDRQEISDLVYDGQASPAFGFWPEDHVYYNPEVDDIAGGGADEAEQLLDGQTVAMDLAIIGVVQNSDTIAQILQAQLGDIGFDVNIVVTQDPVSEWIVPQAPGALLIPGSRSGADKYVSVYEEGQVQSLCGRSRPEIIDTLAPATALIPGDPEAEELFQEAEELVAEDASVIPIVFQPNLIAWNSDRLGGEQRFNSAQSQPLIDTFHVKAG